MLVGGSEYSASGFHKEDLVEKSTNALFPEQVAKPSDGTITLLVLQMTPLMQIEKIALDHHIPIIISTQKKYSK